MSALIDLAGMHRQAAGVILSLLEHSRAGTEPRPELRRAASDTAQTLLKMAGNLRRHEDEAAADESTKH